MWIDEVRDALSATDTSALNWGPECPGVVGVGKEGASPDKAARVVTFALPTTEGRALKELFKGMRENLERAHPFVFASTPVEATENRGVLRMPPLTADEVRFFNDGIIPAPFPSTFFEYRRGDGPRIGILAVEGGDASGARWIDLWKFKDLSLEARAPVIEVTSYAIRLIVAGTVPTQLPAGIDQETVEPMVADLIDNVKEGRPPKADAIHTGIVDPVDGYEAHHLLKTIGFEADGWNADPDHISDVMRSEAKVFVYLALMLGSKSTTIELTKPKSLSEKRRVASGLSRSRDHHVVHIYPRGIREALKIEGDLIAVQRRIHWRRSHSRRLPTGRETVVARHIVGFKRLDGSTLDPNAYTVSKGVGAMRRDHEPTEACESPRAEGTSASLAPPRSKGGHPAAEAPRGNAAFELALDRIMTPD